nr:bacteriohemerythrin [uncultured Holophaga sp.]
MELMHWHDSYSVGVKLVDDHHRRLFVLINELILAAESRQGGQSIQSVFDAVVDYARMHFRVEEALFREDPEAEGHGEEHRAFESFMTSFSAEQSLEAAGELARLLRYLSSWLRNHILETDMATFSRLGYRPRETWEAFVERLRLLTLKPTVLLAEDSLLDRLFLRRCLESEGYSVLEASGGREALALAESSHDLHLVVTDLSMTEGSGFDLIQGIRARNLNSVYILVVTEATDKETLVRAFHLGANDYLTKPIYPEELKLRVRNGMNLIRLESQDELIFAMANLVDCRSPETGRHLERVQNYCRLLAQELLATHPTWGLTEGMVHEIGRYSPLHDIGKVAVADAILNKPGRLSAEEFEAMKEHARVGGELIGRILRKTGSRSLSLAYDLTMHHHERWDGQGYPDGLKGEQIPMAARIMALADVYDALTCDRVYRPAMPHAAARELVLQGRGTQFDPQVVDAFLAHEGRFEEICRQLRD